LKESKIAGGRIGVYIPSHPKANNRGYVLRYRIVMEEYLGRLLEEEEHVHHCNGDKTDDVIENLELTLVSAHAEQHSADYGDFGKRKLDYEAISNLREAGYGYKRIAAALCYPLSSVKSAVRKLERGHY
jgi:hypothetical protein